MPADVVPTISENCKEFQEVIDVSDVESPMKKKAKLCDVDINFAQQLLKSQFPKINGLACTLYQEKKVNFTAALVQNNIQIIYCKSRHHWIVASTFWCYSGEFKVCI